MAVKERENFCRNAILIVDHAKDSLVDLLELHLTLNSLSFEDFINDHQHHIYHLCFNKKCCHQCPQGYELPPNRVLYPPQLKILLDEKCCLAKPGVTTDVLDITLARCLLITFCGDVLSCSLLKNIDTLHQMRNNVYGHAKQGRITDDDYRIYKNKIESAIREIAKVCRNETERNQILMDLEKRSLDEGLCMHYQNTLLEWIARETQLEEILYDLAEKMPEIVEKAVAKALDDNAKQKLTKDVIVGVQPLQETRSLTSTPSSGNQSSQIENLFNDQINLQSPTMNQTNNIERNNLAVDPTDHQAGAMTSYSPESSSNNQSGQGHQSSIEIDAEPYNVNNDLENKRDHQAGAMTSYSPESSSNDLSRGNDQSGQGHQSSIETDAEPYNVNNDLEDNRGIYDGAVLHAEEDRNAAIEFITNMKKENPNLEINITLYENLFPGKSIFQSAAEIFDICRYLFVFVTQNFVNADLEMFLASIVMHKTLTREPNVKDRLITVKTAKNCDPDELAPYQGLKYYHYLETKEKKKNPDYYFIKGFTNVIDDGRKKYLKKIVN